ncbi:DHH family phosphoesterase [uncultured Methanofollis sp.]|uniref:DHH family phosphoesterase n=1 Tax=uncultured Methanofollis sp. TaxID=262500 RepID=UPI002639CE4B|nr:OB-fold nucleic acid binding domain-containing protein [uncultured Methanofollis sp.]
MANTEDTIVYALGPNCGIEDVEEGMIYAGTVQGFANFGTFVQLNARLKGLVHKSNILQRHEERDQIYVKVINIRNNGNIDLAEVVPEVFRLETVTRRAHVTKLGEIQSMVGRSITLEAQVAQVKQTSGPTIFTLVDESGSGNAAAFVEAGVRAYPEVDLGDVVCVSGEVMRRQNQLQIEVSSMEALTGDDAKVVHDRIEAALDARAEPEDVPLLVESEVLRQLQPEMRKVAKLIRRAVFEAQPIILRHHADADGICAAAAVEQAVISLMREEGDDLDTAYYLFKRSPSKAPFYEVEDITRDLDFALKDHERFGQKMPLIVLMDNGSTEEDLPSMKMARVYDLPMIVVDHHHPDAIVDEYVIAHVNPYHAGGDFGITAGMLGTEVARLINPKVSNLIRHLPAVAGVGDRSEAPERQRYLDLVADEYSEDACKDIALALDYEQFWLRFNDGRELIKDILNLKENRDLQKRYVDLLVEQANEAIEDQMAASMPHVVEEVLPNGAHLFRIDVEIFAHRFTFPPPGKTAGEIHDRLCQQHPGEPVVTLGFGPDFAVLRSRGVLMNIPKMVRELRDEITGGGISGGGHLVVGSIKFVEGMRDAALSGLVEKIGQAEVEEL